MTAIRSIAIGAALLVLAGLSLFPVFVKRDPCEPLPRMFATHGQCVVVQEFYARRAG